jgi:hypothetical protein
MINVTVSVKEAFGSIAHLINGIAEEERQSIEIECNLEKKIGDIKEIIGKLGDDKRNFIV